MSSAQDVYVREKTDETDLPPLDITFDQCTLAAYRIRSCVQRTDCVLSHEFSSETGAEVYLKLEVRQETGSFKERGAANTLLSLSKKQKEIGVVAASAGNHGSSLAYHGWRLNIPVTIVMPTVAPLTKRNKCAKFGAEVHINGATIAESKEFAMELAEKTGKLYVNGYDDASILAGTATIGMEILEQVPDVDAIVVPVGGGGLMAGIALAVHTLRPDVELIGVEPKNCASMMAALKAGKPVRCEAKGTLADGLAVPTVGSRSFEVVRRYVDKIVAVSEKYIALSVLRCVESERLVVEGSGSAGLGAIFQGLLPELKGKKVVTILCGGNIDTVVLGQVIERGLAADGRLIRFECVISDKPGSLSKFIKLLADENVSVRECLHERAFLCEDLTTVTVRVVCETTNKDHAKHVFKKLAECGYTVQSSSMPLVC